jgi:hypothetical protein
VTLHRGDGDTRPEPVTAPSGVRHMSLRTRGVWLGVGAAGVLAVTLIVAVATARETGTGPELQSQPLWAWLARAIVAATYLAGFVLAVPRSTQRLGEGVLIGFTASLPVALLFGIRFVYYPS